MMGKKKKSSNHPVRVADVKRAKQEAVAEAVDQASVLFLTVLLDKYNGGDYIADVWRDVQKLSDEVGERRVSLGDLRYVLKSEYGIVFGGKKDDVL